MCTMFAMKSKCFLPSSYFPNHDENRMSSEGDVVAARDFFYKNTPNNLYFLLQERYDWMNLYISSSDREIYELGAGAGFSKTFIKNSNFKMTDVLDNPWIDMYADALKLPFPENSVDVLICSHMIHHLALPRDFFDQVHRVLKKGGLLLISDIETSGFMMRFLLRMMKHEGWSYDVDVFGQNVVNDPKDPWSANCAIPEMLFSDKEKFTKNFPGFNIERNELTECIIFPISGGVIAKSPTINLPFFILKILRIIDKILIKLFPSFFAMGRRVVLRKI